MKVIANRVVEVQEANSELRIPGIKFSVSILRPSPQCAQVVVCDRTNKFTNMVCIMNMPTSTMDGQSNITSSILVDDAGPKLDQGGDNQEQLDDDESSVVSDLAKVLGEKICKKAALTQLFFSLNIDVNTARSYGQNFKLMMLTEKRVSDLIKSLDQVQQNVEEQKQSEPQKIESSQ